MLRRLPNIASIVCLVLCVALMGMWVRSYHVWSELTRRYLSARAYQIATQEGRLFLFEFPLNDQDDPLLLLIRASLVWPNGSQPIPLQSEFGAPIGFSPPPWTQGRLTPLGFVTYFRRTGSILMLPYWFLVLTSGSLAMLLRLRRPWRFTLRTLFIATTFLAVVLGMIAWLDHSWIGK
jgi:hypothetical protein